MLTSKLVRYILKMQSILGNRRILMKKEEILAKSRMEKTDEGILNAENKGMHYGVIAFSAVFIFIVVINIISGISNYAPFAMFWAFLAAEAYPRYCFAKDKGYLWKTILSAIASLLFLLLYFIETVC